MKLPECNQKKCANCNYSSAVESWVCVALEKSLLNNGYCPFFKDTMQASNDRKAAAERADQKGIYVNGKYPGPRFTKRIKNAEGETETVADIDRWMENLVEEGIIPQGRLDAYRMAN